MSRCILTCAGHAAVPMRRSNTWRGVRHSLSVLLLHALSLSGGCAVEGDDHADDYTIGEEAAQQVAPAPSGKVDFSQRGPHEVVQENNLGQGFETAGVDDTAICNLVVPTLTNGEATAQQIRDFVKWPAILKPKLHTVFRPKTLQPNTVYPVILWGNGTCSAPIYYEPLLGHLASHGFIVVAPNLRIMGDGEPALLALAFLEKENARPQSPFYQKLDLKRVGTAGHTQGAETAIRAAEDPRVVSILPIESPSFPDVKKPTFFLAGGEDNIVPPDLTKEAYDNFDGPAVYGVGAKVDHVSPLAEAPLLTAVVTAWFKATITDDPAGAGQFSGACALCSLPDWTFTSKKLEGVLRN